MIPMKTKSVLLAAAVLCSVVSSIAVEKIVGGPKGGRLLDAEPQQAEFFVNADRKVEVSFYDAALKPVAPAAQVVSVSAEPKGGRTPIEMEKTTTGFVSKSALPAGEPYRVVVQVREKPEAKPKNFRIDFNLEQCGECKRAEYACICEGH
ncbi:MAG: hypothetical protein HYV95_09915 [Opitutae bacterium]|nr:hypothetical protein [Opitutae bacterium]